MIWSRTLCLKQYLGKSTMLCGICRPHWVNVHKLVMYAWMGEIWIEKTVQWYRAPVGRCGSAPGVQCMTWLQSKQGMIFLVNFCVYVLFNLIQQFLHFVNGNLWCVCVCLVCGVCDVSVWMGLWSGRRGETSSWQPLWCHDNHRLRRNGWTLLDWQVFYCSTLGLSCDVMGRPQSGG